MSESSCKPVDDVSGNRRRRISVTLHSATHEINVASPRQDRREEGEMEDQPRDPGRHEYFALVRRDKRQLLPWH